MSSAELQAATERVCERLGVVPKVSGLRRQPVLDGNLADELIEKSGLYVDCCWSPNAKVWHAATGQHLGDDVPMTRAEQGHRLAAVVLALDKAEVRRIS